MSRGNQLTIKCALDALSLFQAMTRVPDIIKERSSALDCFRRGCVAVYAHTYTLHMSYPRRLEAASVCHHKIKRS